MRTPRVSAQEVSTEVLLMGVMGMNTNTPTITIRFVLLVGVAGVRRRVQQTLGQAGASRYRTSRLTMRSPANLLFVARAI